MRYLPLLLLVFLFACGNDEAPVPFAPPLSDAAAEYVYAHTNGEVSRTAPVQVQFTRDMVAENTVGQSVATSLLSTRPKTRGTLEWTDRRTLRYTPTEPLAGDQTYLVTVALDQLVDDLPEGAEQLQFNFRTRALRLTVADPVLRAASNTELRQQVVEGRLVFSDAVTAERVGEVLTARQADRKLPVTVTPTDAPETYRFRIADVTRGEQKSAVQLAWNGEVLGIDATGERELIVPPLDYFRVSEVRAVTTGTPHILVYFTDPLQADQDLRGSVQLPDYTGTPRFLIDGNVLRIDGDRPFSGETRVRLTTGVRNVLGRRSQLARTVTVSFAPPEPGLRLVGRGVIVPGSDGMLFPFEAKGLRAVEVEVFKIFNNNILQFLQYNQLDGENNMEMVGRVVQRKSVELTGLTAEGQRGDYTAYALQLDELLHADPEAIYQIRIGFTPDQALDICADAPAVTYRERDTYYGRSEWEDDDAIPSIWTGYYGINGYYEEYRYQHRNDPCYPGYYNTDRFVRRNVVASNLGLIAKATDDKTYTVVVTDLRTTDPLPGSTVRFYDFQQQLIKEAQTDAEGILQTRLPRKAFLVTAAHNADKGYLRLLDGNALSLSRFDVGGVRSQAGMKGFFYAERGVWRPGDSLALNFVLESEQDLPADYPLEFEWFDPRGVSLGKRTLRYSVGGIYPVALATAGDAPTGNYRALVRAGGAEFSRTLQIETVKPNRLKVRVELPQDGLSATNADQDIALRANWLHGAPASNLKAKVEAQVSAAPTTFPAFVDFSFTDATRNVSGGARVIYDGQLDAEGKGRITEPVVKVTDAPGKLRVRLRTRVFESGGDYSLNAQSVGYDPYAVYAGARVPTDRYGGKRLNVNQNNTLQFAAVDAEGRPVSGRALEIGLYRVGWSWWYDQAEGRGNYSFDRDNRSVVEETVTTGGRGVADYAFTPTDYGAYLLRVCDAAGGHCATERVYVGYPWDDDDNDLGREAAAQLAFTTNQDTYAPGETVEVTLPAGDVGRILLTVENGSGVLQTQWQDAVAGMNTIRFQTTADMAPNVYAHVELLQPHAQTKNDLPIRMYGVVPVRVEDPATRLQPELRMAGELRPEQRVELTVSEADGRPMAYTVALVDEGLLDLTNFDTPDAWDHFYAREALGVQTWDLYDEVLGAYGGRLDRLLAIGGDGEVNAKDTEPTANRFEPVVRTLGPFLLEKNKSQTHTVQLPNYVGSVKAMVVATNGNGAYGSTARTAPVKQPLMVLATLPRVLGPGETLRVPISVFAMEAGIRDVELTLTEANGLASFPEGRSKRVQFAQPGEQLVEIPVQMADRVGIAKFTIIASSGAESALQEIELQVRNPNPYVNRIVRGKLPPGEIWNGDYRPVGVPGTNEATLEISALPPLNLEKRLDYLLRYPYGCLEQTTSSVFPQLYVDNLLELDNKQQETLRTNVRAGIQRLRRFVTASGGLAYWPGNRETDPWATNYAGHFLLEARAKGYTVPVDLLDGWQRAQRTAARNWRVRGDFDDHRPAAQQLDQAYRLYTLALADAPEIGAMNRLREVADLPTAACLRLAAAYALAGKPEVAKQLLDRGDLAVRDYRETGYTYGSALRDRAMLLDALVTLGETERATDLLETVAQELGSERWCSTQETAYGLLAIGKLLAANDYQTDQVAFSYAINGKSEAVNSDRPVVQLPLSAEMAQTVAVRNTSGGLLFARVIGQGQPAVGRDQETVRSKLALDVAYKNMAGEVIDPARIEQGSDFVAEVTVAQLPEYAGQRFQELALDQVFPSGWEVLNARLDGLDAFATSSPADYRDVRDDRVYTFFDQSDKKLTYRIQLNAAYQGRYYLPATDCSAMYDPTIHAQVPGRWVEVVRAGTL